MSTPLLFRGVDLAAFAAALVARLRGAGVSVSASGQASFVQALQHLVPRHHVGAVLGGQADAGQPQGRPRRLRRRAARGFRQRPTRRHTEPRVGPADPRPQDTAPSTPGIVQPATGPSDAAAEKLPWVTRTVHAQRRSARTRACHCRTCCPAASPRSPTNRSTNSIPTTSGCSAPGWSGRSSAGPAAAACGSSPARTARGSTCARP